MSSLPPDIPEYLAKAAAASPAMSSEGREDYKPIPGPVNRVSFFEEQARNRRAAWRIVAACVVLVLVLGVLTSLDLAPIFLAIFIVGTDLVNFALPMPDFLMLTANWLHNLVHAPAFSGPKVVWSEVPYGQIAITIVVASIPGVLLLAAIARAQRSLFARAGVGGTLLALGAREPKSGDLEEHQLVNVVEEMAIAANLTPPKVLLLDADVCNAAVVGSGPGDATVVVTRRLLDELNRDETEGVLGHLIGQIGNGDLRIAFDILAVFTTYGTLTALLDAPFGPMARGILGRMAHLRHAKGDQSAEMNALMRLLVKESQESEDPTQATKTRRGGCLYWLLQPLVWANLVIKFIMFLGVNLILAPLIAWLWRIRRYLADSTAVQLTRDPDGLANALLKLSEVGGLPPGADWAAHLFIVGEGKGRWRGPKLDTPQMQRVKVEAMQKIMEARARGESQDQIKADLMAIAQRENLTQYLNDIPGFADKLATSGPQQGPSGDKSSLESIIGGGNFQPALDKRLRRLQAQGSSVAPPEKKKTPWNAAAVGCMALLGLIIGPLLLAVAILLPMVGIMIGMLAMIIDMIWFGILIVPIHYLLRHLHH